MSTLSKYAYHLLRNRLPQISITEQVALDAGDVWWEGELFNGNPNWEMLHHYPKPQLSVDEKAFLDNQVNTLCDMINDWQFIQQQDLSPEVWAYLKKEKFWGITIAKKYGGLEFSALAHSTIISKIASRSASVAVATMVPNSLGPAELLHYYGTEEQKQQYLPKLAIGEEIPCFALTGLEIGSDASGMPDKGIICFGEYQGEKTLGIKLSWEKRYITLAPIATVIALAFKLYDPDHLLGSKNNIGVTLCLIPTNHPGVEIGKRHRPIGSAFPNGPTCGKDVFIPLEWIIGGVEMAGQGWRMLMESLSIGRGISLPALSAGSSQLCYRMSGAYSHIRKQFKQPIGHFEGVMASLARIGAFTYIIEATRLLSATAVDLKIKPAVTSAIAKCHLTELSRKVVNDAMDIHAGRGIQTGPRNYLAILYLVAPTSITVEGANILTRNLIIYGQGAIRCHRYLKQEMHVLAKESEAEAIKELAPLLQKHVLSGLYNLFRTVWFGITGGYVCKSYGDQSQLKKYYRQLNRMSTALALTSDITLLTLGGNLKRKEFLSARLGDVVSHLLLSSAVLKYHADHHYPPEDMPYVEWSLQYCLQHMQIAFDDFFANFPQRWLGFLLGKMVFPWGRAYKSPTDKLSQKIAEHMLQPSKLRDRISKSCYLKLAPDDLLGRMELTLDLLMKAEPIEKKLKKTGSITPEEEQLLKEYDKARIDAIKVDEF